MQRQAVGTAPGNAAPAVQPPEAADEEHAEINSGWNAGLSAILVIGRAKCSDKLVKARLGQHGVEFRVKGMAGTGHDLHRRNEQFVLFGNAFANSHDSETLHCQICSVKYATFLTGC